MLFGSLDAHILVVRGRGSSQACCDQDHDRDSHWRLSQWWEPHALASRSRCDCNSVNVCARGLGGGAAGCAALAASLTSRYGDGEARLAMTAERALVTGGSSSGALATLSRLGWEADAPATTCVVLRCGGGPWGSGRGRGGGGTRV